MKKRGIKLIAGLVTAGMLAVTCFVGIQSVGDMTSKTVMYKMQENQVASGFDYSPTFIPRSDDTGYPNLSGLEKSLPKGTRYVRVKMQGYNQPVLVVFHTGSNYYAYLYTEKSGRNVRCIGEIRPNTGIAINNGIIYTVYDNTDTHLRCMSFLVRSDGDGLVVKDYIDVTVFRSQYNYWGYSNCDDKGNMHHIKDDKDGEAIFDKFSRNYNRGQWLKDLCKTK